MRMARATEGPDRRDPATTVPETAAPAAAPDQQSTGEPRVGTMDRGAASAPAAERSATAVQGGRRAVGVIAAVALAVVAGLVAAWLTPRGPVSTPEAIGWMVGALVVGLLAGGLSGTRWAVLLVAAGFTVAFELGRLGTSGPTVDGVHIGSTYGIIALVVGRGFSYLLALLPMLLGVLLGVEGVARLGRSGARPLRIAGWLGAAVLGVLVVGLGLLLLRPATTPPIVGMGTIAGSGGASPPDSIAELTEVSLGGHDQALMIRGRSVDAPVLLHLAGGPGGTDLGAMRGDTSLEGDFVVVTWEQRGAGKSYGSLDPVETLTPEQMVADTIELTEYLRDRFDEERIYLHGNSWCSILGVLAVQQRPDLFHAWVGSGQMVSPAETDRMFWEDTVAWAESTANDDLAEQLRGNGPPPYRDILDYEPALSHEHDWNPYPEFDSDRELPATLFVPENTLTDQVNGLRAFLDTFAVLYPQIQGVDLRSDAVRLEVPVYVVTGAHEARGRAVLAAEWFELLEAPAKEWVDFDGSGHRPSFEEPGRFAELMRRVRDETYGQTTARLTP